MARDIQASYRNKGFITSIVTAFEERDLPAFTGLFAQHADPSHYKTTKDNKNPSDYQLLQELLANRKTLDQEDIHTLLLTLCTVPSISPMTKVALYLASFPHVTVVERDQNFGSEGPFALESALGGLRTHLQTLENWEKNNFLQAFRRFYMDSVVKDQSPEDFVSKFKLSQEIGLTAFAAIKQLDYEDADQGPKAIELYQQIFAEVDETSVTSLLWNFPSKGISYDMVKAYGFKAFSTDSSDFGLSILIQAFQKDDVEFFTTLSEQMLNPREPGEWRELIKQLMAQPENAGLSEAQKQMLSTLDAGINRATIREFQTDVRRHDWDGPAGFIMECLIQGDLRLLQSFINGADHAEFQPFFNAIIQEFDRIAPRLLEDGLLGEPQKKIALFIYEIATKQMASIAERLENLDTSKAYRLREMEEGTMVQIPLSELSPEQRKQWEESVMDHQTMPVRRGPRMGPFCGFDHPM
jgi:hypothetical protein